ncbi:hypothetical protein Tco_0506451 [Tanacetum coccineum]
MLANALKYLRKDDKGKGKIEELVKPKKKDLIRLDEEIASKLQPEFDEEEILAREKDEANVAFTEEWDDIQAKIEADHELAQRLQAQEQKELSYAENATLFNMEGKKPKDLKNKSFDSIQKMFDRAFKRVNTFVNFRTDLVEGSSKIVVTELEQENEEEIAIDVVPLATKPPTIVDWKGRIVGIKRLLDDLRVTTAQVCVTAAKLKKRIFKKRNKKKAKNKQIQARNGKDKVKGQPIEENTT